MGLDDVAALLAPGKPENAHKLLMAFYKADRGRSFADLRRETGFGEKKLRYYITRFRYWFLIEYDRAERVYRLDPHGFRARAYTLLQHPIAHLIGVQPRWRRGE